MQAPPPDPPPPPPPAPLPFFYREGEGKLVKCARRRGSTRNATTATGDRKSTRLNSTHRSISHTLFFFFNAGAPPRSPPSPPPRPPPFFLRGGRRQPRQVRPQARFDP